MSTGEHIHDWKYGEPKETEAKKSGLKNSPHYKVIRFCVTCRKAEEIFSNNT